MFGIGQIEVQRQVQYAFEVREYVLFPSWPGQLAGDSCLG